MNKLRVAIAATALGLFGGITALSAGAPETGALLLAQTIERKTVESMNAPKAIDGDWRFNQPQKLPGDIFDPKKQTTGDGSGTALPGDIFDPRRTRMPEPDIQ